MTHDWVVSVNYFFSSLVCELLREDDLEAVGFMTYELSIPFESWLLLCFGFSFEFSLRVTLSWCFP